jgi:hypothetical protein
MRNCYYYLIHSFDTPYPKTYRYNINMRATLSTLCVCEECLFTGSRSNNQADQDTRSRDWRGRNVQFVHCTLYSIEEGEDGEERFEEKPKKHLYLTVPPAVALLN